MGDKLTARENTEEPQILGSELEAQNLLKLKGLGYKH